MTTQWKPSSQSEWTSGDQKYCKITYGCENAKSWNACGWPETKRCLINDYPPGCEAHTCPKPPNTLPSGESCLSQCTKGTGWGKMTCNNDGTVTGTCHCSGPSSVRSEEFDSAKEDLTDNCGVYKNEHDCNLAKDGPAAPWTSERGCTWNGKYCERFWPDPNAGPPYHPPNVELTQPEAPPSPTIYPTANPHGFSTSCRGRDFSDFFAVGLSALKYDNYGNCCSEDSAFSPEDGDAGWWNRNLCGTTTPRSPESILKYIITLLFGHLIVNILMQNTTEYPRTVKTQKIPRSPGQKFFRIMIVMILTCVVQVGALQIVIPLIGILEWLEEV